MASPPFNPNQALPGDSDIVSVYPAAERTFRDIVESWLLFEHGTSGHHKLKTDTTANIAADTTWEVGSICFDTTLNILKHVTSIGPVVFHPCGIEKNTRVVFQQTSAPLGYTKESNALYNDAAMVGTTGSVATGGTTAASARYVDQSITLVTGNLPAHTHDKGSYTIAVASISGTAASAGSHSHTYTSNQSQINVNGPTGSLQVAPFSGVTTFGTTSDGAHTHTVSGTGAGTVDGGVSGSTGSGIAFTVGKEIKFFSTIVGIKS